MTGMIHYEGVSTGGAPVRYGESCSYVCNFNEEGWTHFARNKYLMQTLDAKRLHLTYRLSLTEPSA